MTGTTNLDVGVIQPMIGAWINDEYVGVDKDDQSGYSTLMFISLICSFISFSLLPLVPLMKDIKKAQRIRDRIEDG